MFDIAIRRSHELSHDRALRVVDAIAADLRAAYGIQSRWQDSTLLFTGHGLSGTLSLSPGLLCLDVRLGLLMVPFRHSISAAIERKLDQELAAAPDGAAAAPDSTPVPPGS